MAVLISPEDIYPGISILCEEIFLVSVSDSVSTKIQALRGLAIIAVVFIHCTPGGLAQVIYRPFLNIGVGLFLFFSGMLSDAKKWNPKKRLIKILIPYAIWTLVYTVNLSDKTPDRIISDYFRHLILGVSSAVMYYVFVYCELTLLIPIIDKIARSKFKYLGFIISPLDIIFFRLLPMIYGIQINKTIGIISGLSCLGWFTYFYLGYLLGNNYISVNSKTRMLTVCWVISLLIQIGEGYLYYLMGNTNCGSQLKLSSVLSGSLFCILCFKYIKSGCPDPSRLFVVLGDSSFGIFFSHLLIKKDLSLISGYTDYVFYPINAIVLIMVSYAVVSTGHKILGRFAKYIAF